MLAASSSQHSSNDENYESHRAKTATGSSTTAPGQQSPMLDLSKPNIRLSPQQSDRSEPIPIHHEADGLIGDKSIEPERRNSENHSHGGASSIAALAAIQAYHLG